MTEENLYGLSDEVIEQIEKQISHAEIDATDSESFLNLVFPNLSSEDKAKIAMFSISFSDTYGEDDEDEYEEETME